MDSLPSTFLANKHGHMGSAGRHMHLIIMQYHQNHNPVTADSFPLKNSTTTLRLEYVGSRDQRERLVGRAYLAAAAWHLFKRLRAFVGRPS